jgi:hypothetical protein
MNPDNIKQLVGGAMTAPSKAAAEAACEAAEKIHTRPNKALTRIEYDALCGKRVFAVGVIQSAITAATAPLEARVRVLEEDKRRLEGLWSETTVELLEARKVVSAACAYVNADVCVHPILSRAEAVKVGADKLIDAVSKWTAAQPPCCDSARAACLALLQAHGAPAASEKDAK